MNKQMVLTESTIDQFQHNLELEEKSKATISKYMHDVWEFYNFLRGRELTKELVISYKESNQNAGLSARTVNARLAAVNHLLSFLGLPEMRAKNLRVQQCVFSRRERTLTRQDYYALLTKAGEDSLLTHVMETICSTGIRVSELQFITVESLEEGKAVVNNKGKTRTILLTGKLIKKLRKWCAARHITAGAVFVGRNGKPLDRSVIWQMMKKLAAQTKVSPRKVFPHNLRKLFARTFYKRSNNIAQLADLLGHSSVDTTRIYIMTTPDEHRQYLEGLGLII